MDHTTFSADVTPNNYISEKLGQDYNFSFGPVLYIVVTTSLNMLLFCAVAVRKKLRKDGFYWLVLAMACGGVLQGAVIAPLHFYGSHMSWEFGHAVCVVYYLLTMFDDVYQPLLLLSLLVHMMIRIRNRDNSGPAQPMSDRAYFKASTALLTLPVVLALTFAALLTNLLKPVVLVRFGGEMMCAEDFENDLDWLINVWLAAWVVNFTMGAVMLLTTCTRYTNAKKFLGTIMAVCIINGVTSLFMIAYWAWFHIRWDSFDDQHTAFGVIQWVCLLMPGLSVPLWMLDRGIRQSVVCRLHYTRLPPESTEFADIRDIQ